MNFVVKSICWTILGLCLGFLILTLVLAAAVDATPSKTADSQGRLMGFNDRFSPEHYRIAAAHFRPWQVLQPQFMYEGLQGVMILAGAVLLARRNRIPPRLLRWYFLGQSAVFPLGWIATVFLIWQQTVLGLVHATLTREDFIDVPFTWIVAQPPWVVGSFVIFCLLPAPPSPDRRPLAAPGFPETTDLSCHVL